MNKQEKEKTGQDPAVHEYRFDYTLGLDRVKGEKHYVARRAKEALKNFRHTCRRRRLRPHHLVLWRWNTVRNSWEKMGRFLRNGFRGKFRLEKRRRAKR